MSDIFRQAINFDLDTKALEKYYPKQSWRAAYDDVKTFFENNGFIHEQGSGYHSKEPMEQEFALGLVRKLIKANPWINKCVNACAITDIPLMYDISTMFDKDAKIPPFLFP